MTVLKVPDMHCQNCVKRITAAFTEENFKFLVNLDEHTVCVDGDAATISRAKETLSDLGFDAE